VSNRIPTEAFAYYVGLGVGRSYQAVADKFGVTHTGIVMAAKREHWQERLVEIERKSREAANQKAVEGITAMNERHLKSLRVIQGKALDTLRAKSIESAMDAVRALDIAIKGERLIKGEPTTHATVSIAETIRNEYERWMATPATGEDEPNLLPDTDALASLMEKTAPGQALNEATPPDVAATD
jgi:hypothetical protein